MSGLIYVKTTNVLRLRERPGADQPILGEIRAGATCYVVGGYQPASNLLWRNIAAPCMDGTWRVGWSAVGMAGTSFLDEFKPKFRLGYLTKLRFIMTQLFAENPAMYAALGYQGHNGVDIGASPGVYVYAAADGVITHSRTEAGGYGKYVRIDHPWGVTLYAHLSQLVAHEGRKVRQGERIGISGQTGYCFGPHLHFEMRLHPIAGNNGYGGRVDPLPYLDLTNVNLPWYMPRQLTEALEYRDDK